MENPTAQARCGKLTIFFGYAAGVGKTAAMLQAARQARDRGVDVAVGCAAPHPPAASLLQGLEILPAAQRTAGELDLDAALTRRPKLLLVDHLAHTNAAGSRHAKRHQDVRELLAAGIDVYATLSVQHIESLSDAVAAITGTPSRERVPDSVFDRADRVVLIDAEPEDLPGASIGPDMLCALRELALRRCADRLSLITQSTQMQRDFRTGEHILVCLSSSPSNAKLIRTAARMANAFRGSFTALFVETPSASSMCEADKKRLQDNMHLARQLGARIETGYGDDVPFQIAEFARLSGVTKIVIGRSTATRKGIFSKPTLTDRLIAAAPSLDIHVIPDARLDSYREPPKREMRAALPLRDIGKSALVLLAATLIGCLFDALGFSEANIVSLYIFGVLVISVITTSRFCGIIAAIVSVLVFNFFFTLPRFTFHFSDSNYVVTFPIMFMVALLTGSLATRLKDSAKQSARAAYRTKLLFETNQLLQKEREELPVARAAAGQILKLLRRDTVIYLSPDGKTLSEPCILRSPDSDGRELTGSGEHAVADWVLRNNKHAGATTDTFSRAQCLYLAIRVNQTVYGVVGVAIHGTPLDSFENSVLLSMLGECALALENIRNAREKEAAAILAQNEQLRANLLRAISHDLRTPLTSISGNADNLLSNYARMDDETRQRTFADIYDDALWLINLVENLLAVTRIEGGQVRLTQTVELMDEVVSEALRHVSRRSREHTLRATSSDELLLARIDARLIVQVLINLVDNAIKYTPAGSVIEIHTEQQGKQIVVSVSDNGPGIPDAQKPHIFDMFYSGTHRVAVSRRSLGLGLSLCKSIVTAHQGTITVADNTPHGAVFQFTLPAEEVELHE